MRLFLIISLLCTLTSAGLLDLKDLGKKVEDLLDLDKFEGLFKGNKINDFIKNLKNVPEHTKNTLNFASKLHEGLDQTGKKHFNDFFQFIIKFGKAYDNDTATSDRFQIFRDSLKSSEELQKKNPRAKFGVTKFTDLSDKEFIEQHTGIKGVEHLKKLHATASPAPIRAKRQDTPSSFDWRDQNGVTSVKDQASCGCCYAFAAVGAIEAAHKIQTGEELDLSEQQAVSCVYQNEDYGNSNGCHGGSSPGVFKYVIDNGITSEEDWPYSLQDTDEIPSCEAKDSVLTMSSQEQLPANDEDNMATVIANTGPIVTYLDAGQIKGYQGGIIDAPEPEGGWKITHAIVTVGYGEEDGTPYWIMKNSWGEDYGEDGYFRVVRGKNSLIIADWNYVVYA